MFSLAPKLYMAIDFEKDDVKLSSKGIQSRNMLKYDHFRQSLYNEETIEVENCSLRMRNHEMQTTKVKKIGLRNTFTKGKLLDDGITIVPFDKLI